MSKKTKALLFNLLGFAVIFIVIRYFAINYTGLQGILRSMTAFVVSTILAPKFQAVKIHGDEKIFMKWIFIKGVKVVG